MIRKLVTNFLPRKFIKLLLTLKHLKNNYLTLSKFAELDRKVTKNVELGDEEYKNFEEFLSTIPKESHSYVDIGAADGVNASCTLQLAKKHKWEGTLFEYGSLANVAYIYRNFQKINMARVKVTPKNVSKLLISYDIEKNFGFLNLDIDSYDYEVIEAILEDGFSPYIISMEINEKIPPPIEFYVYFDDNFNFVGDHFYGCSLTSAAKLLLKHGYILRNLNGNNALFLNKKYFNFESQDIQKAYSDGYLELENRKKVFWYNTDMEMLEKLNPEESKNFIIKKFKNYSGKYYLS
jgi:hypothetical protein|tara:strand:+ start:4443 stop:5321 length:879 start_codon:yes stop_codon:yes gene_type:complete